MEEEYLPNECEVLGSVLGITQAHTYTHTHARKHTHTCIHASKQAHTHPYTRMRVHTQAHTHTHSPPIYWGGSFPLLGCFMYALVK